MTLCHAQLLVLQCDPCERAYLPGRCVLPSGNAEPSAIIYECETEEEYTLDIYFVVCIELVDAVRTGTLILNTHGHCFLFS